MSEPIGPPPMPEEPKPGLKGSNTDVLDALLGLSAQVDALDANVDTERDARLEEKRSRDNQAKWFKIAIGVLSVAMLLSVIAAIASYSTAQKADDTAKETRRVNKFAQDQAKVGLVGICAVVNVNRIGHQNMLADQNASLKIPPTEEWKKYFAKWYAYWEPVDCRASLSDKEKAQICLHYPPKLDPDTGEPVPTTIDPHNETACEE